MKNILMCLSLLVLSTTTCLSQSLTGAGATFPYPLYSSWAKNYHQQTGISVNYQSIGSGAGIKQIIAKTVDFGASDMPLTGEQLDKDSLLQFPVVLGGVAIAFNINGIQSLVLSGEVLADIYSKKITNWNDGRIQQLNRDITLPNLPIVVVYRSDGSGTTYVYTQYLSTVSSEWKTNVGSNTSVKFPVGVGGKGNEGVAATVKQINGAIGYVEYSSVKINKLNNVKLINANGKIVSPSIETFQSAASNIDWTKSKNLDPSMINQPGDNTWPITSPTFILVIK
jgi:phosphate transport system substrate-binding protein